jgi:glycosyltransferase involved in cell wall biosynthesis
MPRKKIKFIYWFAYHDLFASSVRYRAKYPLDFAREKLGIKSYLVVPGYSPARMLKFLKAYFSALLFRKPGSLIVIQRVQSDFIYATLLKLLVLIRKKNSIYDLDDADYLQNKPDTIIDFARRCESIAAGSRAIAAYLGKFNQRIFHVSSAISDLNIVKKKRNPVLTVGWIGAYGFGHKDSLLQFVFPALKELPFSFRLILLGVREETDIQSIKSYFQLCKNIELEIPVDLDWNNETELQNRIVTFDVGIATLLDHPLQIAKSGIKAKQYMNNGVPVLSSNLPENNKVVVNGMNGYLCDSPEDFRLRLTEFHEMKEEEYMRFSDNARNSIGNFNYIKYFSDFEQMMNN